MSACVLEFNYSPCALQPGQAGQAGRWAGGRLGVPLGAAGRAAADPSLAQWRQAVALERGGLLSGGARSWPGSALSAALGAGWQEGGGMQAGLNLGGGSLVSLLRLIN